MLFTSFNFIGGIQELEKAITSNGGTPTGCVTIPRSLDDIFRCKSVSV